MGCEFGYDQGITVFYPGSAGHFNSTLGTAIFTTNSFYSIYEFTFVQPVLSFLCFVYHDIQQHEIGDSGKGLVGWYGMGWDSGGFHLVFYFFIFLPRALVAVSIRKSIYRCLLGVIF